MIPITCNAVGDILALATLVIDVARALKDAHGSSSEYRAFVDELNAIHTMLISAARAAEDSVDRGLRDQVIREVDRCGDDIQRALARVAKFSVLKSDGVAAGGLRLKMKRQWYKVDWRLLRRDEAHTIRKELAMSTQRLTTLLVLSEADGAMRFRKNVMRQVDASIARDNALLRAIETNKHYLHQMNFNHRRDQTLVNSLFTSIPDGIDSRTAAIAVLCAAVCALHAPDPYSRVVPTALLLILIHFLSKSSERHQRALVQDVAYSASNAVALIDALERHIILPMELCGTVNLFHSTLINLFSHMNSSWLIQRYSYDVRGKNWLMCQGGPCVTDLDEWHFLVVPGVQVKIEIIVRQVFLWHPGSEVVTPVIMCPVCCSQVLVAPCGDFRSVDTFIENLECRACGITFAQPHFRSLQDVFRTFRVAVDFGCLDAPGSISFDYCSTPPQRFTAADDDYPSHMRDNTSCWIGTFAGLARVGIEIAGIYGGWHLFSHPIHSRIYVPDRQDERWLLSAIENGCHALAAELLREGVQIDSYFISGYTALHLASFHGQVQIMHLLLDHGIEISPATEDDITPLACAVGNRQWQAMTFLIERGALIESSRPQLISVLRLAADADNVEAIQVLLDYGLDIDTPLDNDGTTSLYYAACRARLDTVRFLLHHGANPLMYSQLVLLLHKPRHLRIPDIVKWIFEWKGIDDCTAISMITKHPGGLDEMLYLAVSVWPYDLDQIMRLLLESGGNPNVEALPLPWMTVPVKAPWNALQCASFRGHIGYVKMLIEHGADVNACTRDGYTPLSLALAEMHNVREGSDFRGDHKGIVRMLLSWGATVDERSALLLQEESRHQVGMSSTPHSFVVTSGWPEAVAEV